MQLSMVGAAGLLLLVIAALFNAQPHRSTLNFRRLDHMR
jgi:hypothetical protein